MKRWFFVLLTGFTFGTAYTQDTLRSGVSAAKMANQNVIRLDRHLTVPATRLEIYGEYKISGYAILSTKTPSREELNALVGSLVKVDTSTITGSMIDPITFTIVEVERLKRDDYIYRVFGREIKAPEPDLPDSFSVHKTDNERCYGIVEIGDGRLAIPYKGVLLYLDRK